MTVHIYLIRLDWLVFLSNRMLFNTLRLVLRTLQVRASSALRSQVHFHYLSMAFSALQSHMSQYEVSSAICRMS